jgi:hypothetical protein
MGSFQALPQFSQYCGVFGNESSINNTARNSFKALTGQPLPIIVFCNSDLRPCWRIVSLLSEVR